MSCERELTTIKIGEIIYLIKCKKVNIEISLKKYLFKELPVLYLYTVIKHY